MNTTGFSNGKILIPQVEDMTAWSVIACDQYTSQPHYWRSVENLVKTKPSTLNMIIPEIYLESEDIEQRIASLNRAIRTYLRRHIFQEVDDYIYTQRTLRNGKVRHGIVGLIDLEQYDFAPGTRYSIRASEGTILGRIPPRLKARQSSLVEVSHIMILIDDREHQVIEPLNDKTKYMQRLYNFELMENAGRISGYKVTPEQSHQIDAALTALASPEAFAKKYNVYDKGLLIYAVGDGNHSLATAKEYYREIKQTLPKEVSKNHPARYALAEIVNLNDSCLEFEPINRIVFGVDVQNFLRQLEKEHDIAYAPCEGQYFDFVLNQKPRRIWIKDPSSNIVTGTVQNFIDNYIKNFSGKVDYVHGDSIVKQLSILKDNVGIIFPSIKKEALFESVLIDGALPRKTFSMGHADDKRFYLECRKIK